MSSGKTHMFLGAVGGWALSAHLSPERSVVGHALAAGVCAFAATWPDLDEPGSWLSRRLTTGALFLGLLLGLLSAGSHWFASGEALTLAALELAALNFALGALAGGAAGWLIVHLTPTVAGGHRAGTHGLLAPALLGAAAWGLLRSGHPLWLPVPLVMVAGWALHIAGDIVTPHGWRPLAPVAHFAIKLPHPIAAHGEKLVVVATVVWAAAQLAGLPRG